MSSAQLASFINRQSLLLKFWFDTADKAAYDSFQVWRSMGTEGGPYEELTGPVWGPAVFSIRTRPKSLNGKLLELVVGSVPLIIAFDGADPWDPSDMAASINAQGLGLVQAQAFDSTGYLHISTTVVGCRARLEVSGGEAAFTLGLPIVQSMNVHYGVDARPRLTASTSYQLEDVWGHADYFYKTRMCTSDGQVSEFSNPITGNSTRIVSPENLVRGSVRIVDLEGKPCGNRTVMIGRRDGIHHSFMSGLLVDTQDQVITTDATGYASVLLIRGVQVTVSVAGTALVRDITPPQDLNIDSFNLFDPAVGTDDAFVVQTVSLNIAERGA